jgi:glycosyltransferase involved in cell wall biosynthesis
MEDPWKDVEEAGAWLLELAHKTGAQIIHLNEPVYGSLPWEVPTVAVAHSCVLSWWESVRKTPIPSNWNRYRQEMQSGLCSADAVVAPSAWMLNQLARHYGVHGGHVISNGRQDAGLEPRHKAPLIFAAGRVWDPAKNLLALDAVANGLPWPVYVAGDTCEPGGHRGVEAQHVRLLGSLSACEVAAWLQRATIYASPAHYEPFGLSVLEAALAGCALVLSDLPPLREQWDGRAIFVPSDESATLRMALESLIDHPGLRHALAMRARRHARRVTPRRMARQYLTLYSALLAVKPAQEQACAS